MARCTKILYIQVEIGKQRQWSKAVQILLHFCLSLWAEEYNSFLADIVKLGSTMF